MVKPCQVLIRYTRTFYPFRLVGSTTAWWWLRLVIEVARELLVTGHGTGDSIGVVGVVCELRPGKMMAVVQFVVLD